MDISNTVADEENLSEDSSGGEIEYDEEIESRDSESDKMEFDDEEFNTKDLSGEEESSMVTSYRNKDEQRDDDNLFPNKKAMAVKNKKSYTIEYEWKVQNSKILCNNSNSNDIDDTDIQNLETNGDQTMKTQNGDKSSERRRRKRERKDVTRTPSYNDWLPTHKSAESTDKNKTECIIQYRNNNMSELSTNNIQSDAQTEHKTQCDAQPKKKKRKPRTRRIYSCDLCNKIFKKSSHLIRHVRTHTGEKPFSCGICGDSFSLNSILKSHMLIHTQEKPFSCDLCELRFSRSGDLKSHRRVHTGEKPYQCLFCGRFFRQSGVLKKHERIHTGEKPYTCTICGRSFRQNGDAQKHIRTHTGEKPFECHICGKEFARNNDMQTHVRRHTGEKPYSCGVCSKSFVDNCGLRRHMKIHTRDLKIPRIPELKSKKPKKQKTEILVPSASELMLGIKPELLSKLRPELFLKPKTLDTSEIISKQVTEPVQEISEKCAKVSSKEISKHSKVNSQSPKSLVSISEEFVPEQFEETNNEDSDIETLPLPDSSLELQTNHMTSAFHSGYQELYSSPKPDIFSGPDYEPFLKIKTTQMLEAFPEQISENLEQRQYSSSNPISERPVDYTVQQSTKLISNVSTHPRPLKQFPEDYHREHVGQQMYAGSDISANFRVQRLQDSRSKQFLEKNPGVNVREQFLASTPEMYSSAMSSALPNHLPDFYLKEQLMADKLLDSRHQQSSASMPNFSADSKSDQYKDTNYDQTSTEQLSRPTHELYAGMCRLYPKPKSAVFPDPY